MGLALIGILKLLLDLVWWVIIIQFVLSILLVFNVINRSNDFFRTFYQAIDRMTEPLYRPIRRLLPEFGAIDFSPMVVIIILIALQKLLDGLALDMASSYA